ncbi:hypothetical protein Tco_0659880 [Tanacetum coccineum]
MFGHYEYGSQHTIGGSSSQPNIFCSSSQPNFLESLHEEQSPIEEVDEIQVSSPKKKSNQRRQRPQRRSYRTKKERTNNVLHRPLRKRLQAKVLKECDKWNSGEVSEFMQERKEKKNKRYKSSGDSSFNMRESGDVSFNLNSTTGDEEDEVHEVTSKSSHWKRPSKDESESRDIKKHELELKVAELEIRRMENRQRDEALYESTTNEELKALFRARLFS